MIMQRIFQSILAAGLTLALTACAAAPSKQTAVKAASATAASAKQENKLQNNNFALFLQWFEGEFDNNEQVWQQKETAQSTATGKVENPFEHIHHIFSPIKNPAIGEHLFFVKQTLDGDPTKIYRQRLYRMTDGGATGIKLEIFSFLDETKYRDLERTPSLAAALTLAELKATPGCEVFWRFDESKKSFEGTMQENACKIISKSSGKPIYISDTLKLNESELWISDLAVDEAGKTVWGRDDRKPHVNRKVRYFTGWAAISRLLKSDVPTGKYSYQGKILLHNEGQKVQLFFDDGKPTGYSIELAQLTYQETKTPILKLALIDDKTGKSETYIWANTDATRIGMNLKWIQVGLTEKTARRHFGFD
jgi:CpeT/CpcT family (DUF1001)